MNADAALQRTSPSYCDEGQIMQTQARDVVTQSSCLVPLIWRPPLSSSAPQECQARPYGKPCLDQLDFQTCLSGMP